MDTNANHEHEYGGSHGWGWLIGIVGLGIVLRAAHMLALRRTPWFDHLVVDPEYYDEWARRIAAGDWLGDRPFVRGNPHFEEADFRAAAASRAGRPLSPPEVSRFWFAQALVHMYEHPGFAGRAMLRKVALFWNDFEISDSQDQYLLARDSFVLRLPLLGFGWVAPLALLGGITAVRARRAIRMLGGFVVLYCASAVAFFIFSRYRIQVVPALLPLAATGSVEFVRRARRADWQWVALATAIVLAAGWFCLQTIGIFSPRNEQVVEMQLRHLADMYRTAADREKTIATLQEAVARCPTRCRYALEELSDAYAKTGSVTEGEAYFRRFTREHPEHPSGWRGLIRVLEAARKPEEAAEIERRIFGARQ